MSEQKIDSVISNFRNLCSARNIPYLAVFHPRSYEMKDTAPYGMSNLVLYCDSMHIPFTDVRPCLYAKGYTGQNAEALFWPKDGHFNDLGYYNFAECLSVPVAAYMDSVVHSWQKENN